MKNAINKFQSCKYGSK